MPNTYQEATYLEVLCWTAGTRIKYGPNPKSGKSFIRYDKYMKAKTVDDSLKLGSYPQDLFFDYEHGYITVLGGEKRSAPLDPKDEEKSWSKVDKMLARMHRNWITWKKTFELADQLGVDRRQLTSDKTTSETTEMRAKRLHATAMATMILEDVEKSKRKVTDRDVLAVLKLWGFRENTNRQNVMKEGQNFVFSDTLGLVAGYDGSVMVTQATSEYSAVTQIFGRWLKDHTPAELQKHGFGFSSINVNANYAAALHRDGNNEGPSMIKAFGEFEGGELNYWGDDDKTHGPVEKCCKAGDKMSVDLGENLLLFDGNRGHSVNDFKGERYSLVFFCVGLYDRANKAVKAELERCGIQFPSQTGMAAARSLLGAPRGYKDAKQKKGEKPALCCWAQAGKATGANFLTAVKVQEAKRKALEFEDVEKECTDVQFVSHKIKYHILPDGRRSVRFFMVGASSGGLRLAVSADEDRKGSGHYLYQKVPGFKIGPALSPTHRIADVRAWAEKFTKKSAVAPTGRRCVRSSSAAEEVNQGKRKRSQGKEVTNISKRAKVAGA
eukprot:CAMPEP_0197650138 /NCGR_PEP_ID=MMETSP1338-20131121/30762_1 /TAXON_ID=43686 ORGANISM="Pelagodinium beii, Strain RCC1491" /NCGR_SAMPLE_ID=MMETSP1338 /ASSEMBLY_ACC=CAM_ASM_000754 /LENGTH=552 /DNA_ID=CAMNT_0043224489 /DNA_START=55 /DNA_END=1713 /DNA_ORIENTATION=+